MVELLLNLIYMRCYKLCYIALTIILLHIYFKVSISDIKVQGESQVYVFHLPVELGFLPFYDKDSLSLTRYLVAAESRISKQSSVQDV